jgi:hypothetical protein
MRGGKGPRNYSTGKWNTRPQRGESLKGFFFSSISMSLPLQFENPPTQRLTTPAPRDRTALERVVRKPAPTSHFIIPPRTACTITLLEMATSKTHQKMRICISTIPPIPRTQQTADANLHSFSEIPPTCTLLQVACRQKRQAPLISRHSSPPPTSSSNWFSSPPPHWRKAKRTVSGAKNRAGVGVPLLAELHFRQPSTTSSHLVGLEMRCTNTCCGRENGSDGESHPTAGERMDGWRGAELSCLGY